MNIEKKSLRCVSEYAILFVIVSILNVCSGFSSVIPVVSSFLLVLFSTGFYVYVRNCLVHRSIRRMVIYISIMIILWFILRSARLLAFYYSDSGTIGRLIWYAYYIPMLMIPLCLFYTAAYVGKKENESVVRQCFIWNAVTFILMFLVLTNDYHRLVYSFNKGFTNWDTDYSKGIVYYLIILWITILFVSAFSILLNKCRKIINRKNIVFPIIPMIMWILLSASDLFGFYPSFNGNRICDLPESMCLSIACFISSCISIGLIPSNHSYGKMFSASLLNATVTDSEGNTKYSSQSDLTKTDKNENRRDFSIQISGGYVNWFDDITSLNELRRKLENVNEKLSEETELIRLQNRLDEERSVNDFRNALYDRIAREVYSQLKTMSDLTLKAEKDTATFRKDMYLMCLYCAYVKRYANLRLLSEKHNELSVNELKLSVSESLRFLTNLNVKTCITGEPVMTVPTEYIISVYSLFQNLIESSIGTLTGVTAVFPENKNILLKLVIENASEHQSFMPDIISYKSVYEDGNLYITVPIPVEMQETDGDVI